MAGVRERERERGCSAAHYPYIVLPRARLTDPALPMWRLLPQQIVAAAAGAPDPAGQQDPARP